MKKLLSVFLLIICLLTIPSIEAKEKKDIKDIIDIKETIHNILNGNKKIDLKNKKYNTKNNEISNNEESEILVIELPSNKLNELQFVGVIKVIDLEIIQFFLNENNVIVDPDGKELIKMIVDEENYYYFELIDNITEEDLIFDMPNDLKERFEQELNKHYNKIKFVFKNKKYEIYDNTIVIDMTQDIYEGTYLDVELRFTVMSLLDGGYFPNVAYSETLKYDNQEVLDFDLHFIVTGKYEYNLTGDVYSFKLFKKDNINIDDIIYELTDSDKELLMNTSNPLLRPNVDFNNYSRIVLKFSDIDYTDESDFVIDTNIEDHNAEDLSAFSLLASRNNLLSFTNIIAWVDDNNHKKLFGYKDDETMIFADNITYEDNYLLELTEELSNAFSEDLGVNVKKLLIKLADPIFLEGENQSINTEENNKLSFRLNIDYGKFIKNGKVYIDNNLIDKNSYTAKEGSTIIIFNKNYAKTLNEDSHKIKVEMYDGEVETTFNTFKLVTNPLINPKTGVDKGFIAITITLVISLIVLLFVNKKIFYIN